MENEIALEETIPNEQMQTKTSETETLNDLESEDQQETQISSDTLTIPVKYNKQHFDLSVERASELAQKGMKFDDMRTVMDKLTYLSAATGKSADKILDALVEQNENELAERVRVVCGDDEVLFSKLLALEHAKHQKAFDRVLEAKKNDALQDEKKENERIAEQFIELSQEFPEIENVGLVPQQVFEIAQSKNISLLDGYLRYKHSEDVKVNAARQNELLAAKSSAGSQQSSVLRTNEIEDAFMKGIWNKN